LFFGENPRRRANLVAACAKVLMEIEQKYYALISAAPVSIPMPEL
jgi:hypothetical protein